jgi:predicted PurR-regulated permease PerM
MAPELDDSAPTRAPGFLQTGRIDVQQVARVVFVVALCAVGLWILSGFVPAILWAVVLAVSTWGLRASLSQRVGTTAAAGLLTALIAIVSLVPLVALAVEGAREALPLIQWIRELRDHGIGTPAWIAQLPFFGAYLSSWWQDHLSDPETARELIGRLGSFDLLNWTRQLGSQFFGRLVILAFTLLTLFFLYRDGDALVAQSIRVGNRMFGPRAEHLGENAVATVRATVNGLVFVGLGEGAVMGIAYAALGLDHAFLYAVITGVVAAIPFGAPIVFVVAALVLFMQARLAAAIALLLIGSLVVFVADHFIRPILIGSATRLPFLLILLGIFGGLETFGLIGLFLGPAIMSVLFAIWREQAAASRQ